MREDLFAIRDLLDIYAQGFHEGNIEKLQQVFHPQCHLYSAPQGALIDDDMISVYERVAHRIKPAERGDPFYFEVLTLDQSGPDCAFARLKLGLGDKLFTDYLTWLKIDGRWWVITKTFTAEMRPDVAPLA